MPPKRKRVRVKRPKRYVRRSKTTKSRISVSKHVNPVTDALVTRLYYSQQVAHSIVAPTVGISPVAMYQTSLFDPDANLGGHQPMWFDQYCPNFYTSYIVMGFWYTITVSARPNVDAIWTVYVRHANTTVLDGNPQNAMERVGTMVKTGTPTGGSRTMVMMKGYLSTAKVRGLTAEKIRTDPQYEGTSSVNPPAMAYLHLGIYTASGVTTGYDVLVKLRYNVRFTGRVTPGGS